MSCVCVCVCVLGVIQHADSPSMRRAVRLPKLQLTLFGRIGEATDDADATLLVHQLMIKVI